MKYTFKLIPQGVIPRDPDLTFRVQDLPAVAAESRSVCMLTATQVGFGGATDELTGSDKMTWDDVAFRLTLGEAGSSAIVQGPDAAAGSDSNGGDMEFNGGGGDTSGTGGASSLLGGIAGATGEGGIATVKGGRGGSTSGSGGMAFVGGGDANVSGDGGVARLAGGAGVGGGNGADVEIYGGGGAVSGRVKLQSPVVLSSYAEGAEQSAPAAPPADGYRIYAVDNGAGKTKLMVIFSSGAAQQLAIQP